MQAASANSAETNEEHWNTCNSEQTRQHSAVQSTANPSTSGQKRQHISTSEEEEAAPQTYWSKTMDAVGQTLGHNKSWYCQQIVTVLMKME
jgi:hypothetical protein